VKRLALCLLLSIFTASALADVVVIVSARSAVLHLTAAQATRIFLGKSMAFPDGAHAMPVDQAEGAAIRDEFYSKVVGKDHAQMTAYWAKVIFTGGDSYPPKLLEGNASVRRAVAGNLSAIGYIDRSMLDGSVRVVLDP
jgi:ABC-type phosphate transport system substrate-binding protein